MQRLDARSIDPLPSLAALRRRLSPRGDIVSEAGRTKTLEVFGEAIPPCEVVLRICRDVQERGLLAVLDYTRRLDDVELSLETLRVTGDELKAAHAQAEPGFLDCIRRVRDRIARFQSALRLRDVEMEDTLGGVLSQRYVPIGRVGVCVPGGAAAYPSTVLMTVIPAQVAGVGEIAVTAPPTRFGSYNADLLATCHELGIGEVYRLGGAQAIAAMAYGVEGMPRVDKIVGPGNLFVALAKTHVFGEVGLDAIAGPSEIVVIADGTTPPSFTAADLIAQAEHAPGAAILITWDPSFADAVERAIAVLLAQTPRGNLARQSLEKFGIIILCGDEAEAARIADSIAPEHLHIAMESPEKMLEAVRQAGAVFVGSYSPVAVGDYVAGPSHVLPTSGTARFASGLTVNDFLRGHSLVRCTAEGLRSLADDIRRLAEREQLAAHWESVRLRCE